VVFGREGNDTRYKNVILAEKVSNITIPAPIAIDDFKME
jgi:hypothetical protein